MVLLNNVHGIQLYSILSVHQKKEEGVSSPSSPTKGRCHPPVVETMGMSNSPDLKT
jgi:hypothetical protein